MTCPWLKNKRMDQNANHVFDENETCQTTVHLLVPSLGTMIPLWYHCGTVTWYQYLGIIVVQWYHCGTMVPLWNRGTTVELLYIAILLSWYRDTIVISLWYHTIVSLWYLGTIYCSIVVPGGTMISYPNKTTISTRKCIIQILSLEEVRCITKF